MPQAWRGAGQPASLRVEMRPEGVVVRCSACCVRSDGDLRTLLRRAETEMTASRASALAKLPAVNAPGAAAAGQDDGTVHVNVPIHPAKQLDLGEVERHTSAYLRRFGKCAEHDDAIVSVRVLRSGPLVTFVYQPCCDAGRHALGRAKDKLETTLSALDRGGAVKLPDGQYLVTGPRVPPGPGQRPVTADVAAAYARRGKLQHIVRTNGEPDVFSRETADEEARRAYKPGDPPPPCTAENIRIFTKRGVLQATEHALQVGKPLSEFAMIFDWERQCAHVYTAPDARSLFAQAGDCPALIEELDANAGETLLVFIFANGRYDRTMRVTGRGHVVGYAAEA